MSLNDNYTYNLIKKKIDAGKPLDELEKSYLNDEAKAAAQEIKSRWQSRGPEFLHLVSIQLHGVASKELPLKHEEPKPRVEEAEPTPSRAQLVFGDE